MVMTNRKMQTPSEFRTHPAPDTDETPHVEDPDLTPVRRLAAPHAAPAVYGVRAEVCVKDRTYWLHLGLRGDATWKDVDAAMRRAWFHDPTHLSRVTSAPLVRFAHDLLPEWCFGEGWQGHPLHVPTREPDETAWEGFGRADRFAYEYDMGTTTSVVLSRIPAQNARLVPRDESVWVIDRNAPYPDNPRNTPRLHDSPYEA